MHFAKPVVLTLIAGQSILLAACGGGGGSPGGTSNVTPTPTPTPTVPVASAQGAYRGNYSATGEHFTLVLDNDQIYTLYGTPLVEGFAITGFLQGNGKGDGSTLTSSDVRVARADNPLVPATLTAKYVPGTSLNGTVTEGASSVAFTGTPVPAAIYDYQQAARINDIAGVWTLTTLSGFAATLDVAASGNVTGTSGACTFTGKITPRASGKNVFDSTLSFGAAPCVLANQTVSGIAVDYLLTNGKRQLIIAGVNPARTSGAAFFGVR